MEAPGAADGAPTYVEAAVGRGQVLLTVELQGIEHHLDGVQVSPDGRSVLLFYEGLAPWLVPLPVTVRLQPLSVRRYESLVDITLRRELDPAGAESPKGTGPTVVAT